LAVGLWAAHPVLHDHCRPNDPDADCPLNFHGTTVTPVSVAPPVLQPVHAPVILLPLPDDQTPPRPTAALVLASPRAPPERDS
jgi:hypothetical protein